MTGESLGDLTVWIPSPGVTSFSSNFLQTLMLQGRGRQEGKEGKLCSMFTADLRGSWVGAVIRQNTGDSMTPLLLFLLLVSTGDSLAVPAGEELCGHSQVDVEDPKLSPAAAALPGGPLFLPSSCP